METNRKAEIIEAARKLFAAQGFSPTSMDDIARDVGITKASLYYFFESKEKIFETIVEEVVSQIKDNLAGELKTCRSGRASIAEMIDRIITISLKNGIVLRPVDVKMANLHPIIFSKIMPMISAIKKDISRLLDCYGVNQSDLAADILVNSLQAYVLQRKHGLKTASQIEYSKYLASLFIK